MKKTVFVAILVLFAITAFGADVFTGESQPEFLMVISAPYGSFDGEILTLEGVSTVIYFSDRPERIAGHMGAAEFVALWDEGENSFLADPPNATLSILLDEGVDNVVLELTDADLMGDVVTFTVNVLEGELPENIGAASLFVDAFPTAVNSQITD